MIKSDSIEIINTALDELDARSVNINPFTKILKQQRVLRVIVGPLPKGVKSADDANALMQAKKLVEETAQALTQVAPNSGNLSKLQAIAEQLAAELGQGDSN